MGKSRKRKFGTCPICTIPNLKLSFDHVPPVCVQTNLNIVYSNVLRIQQTPHHKDFRYSQKGVGFRTICEECNNSLGHKYDWAIKDLVTEVKKYAETSLLLPSPLVSAKCRPVSITKAIVGHLLASQPDFQNSPIDNGLRAFFKSCDAAQGLYLHYWYYPYEQIRIFRDFIMPKMRNGSQFTNPEQDCGVFHLLQFYPIAFLVTDFPVYEDLMNFNLLTNNDDDFEAVVQFDLSNPKHERWPIIAEGSNFFLGGRSIVDSVEARARD